MEFIYLNLPIINIPISKLCHKHNGMKIIILHNFKNLFQKRNLCAEREISRNLSTDAAVDHTKGEKRRAENE